MKIISWNVNSVRARLPKILMLLTNEKPDLLALQETKCQNEEFPNDEFQTADYHCINFGQKRYNGVSFLIPITQAHEWKSKNSLRFSEKQESRALHIENSNFSALNIYAPNGRSLESEEYRNKLNWYTELIKYLSNETADVILGDLNIVSSPEGTAWPESWDNEIFHTKEEVFRFSQLLDLGYEDLFNNFPQAYQYSWWDYRQLAFPKNQGLRIDYILIKKTLSNLVTSYSILRDYRKNPKPSDHAPIMMEINL